MGKEIIMVDSSLFIDYYRKINKTGTQLVELSKKYDFSISVITKFELLVGIKNEEERFFWNGIFKDMAIFPLAEKEVEKTVEIMKYLRTQNQIIGLQDIFIAATAMVNGFGLATLNIKDFVRIPNLKLIT